MDTLAAQRPSARLWMLPSPLPRLLIYTFAPGLGVAREDSLFGTQPVYKLLQCFHGDSPRPPYRYGFDFVTFYKPVQVRATDGQLLTSLGNRQENFFGVYDLLHFLRTYARMFYVLSVFSGVSRCNGWRPIFSDL
jgi:hypothetical protein